MKKPDSFVEVFLSLVKWFLLVLLLNNAIWGFVVYGLVHTTSEDTEINQDGESNIGINNGSIN